MNGFIVLHRKIIDWEWYTDVPTKTLFIHLLLYANHKETKWRGIAIPKGGLVTSLSTLSAQTGLSVKEVRTAIKKLEKTGEVERKSTNQNTLIIITNYELYQDYTESEKPQKNTPKADKGQTKGKVGANLGQTKGNIQQYNNDNNDNNINYIVSIIDFLNQTIGARYTYKNKLYNEMITSRLKDGYTIDDFKEVIKKKADEWTGTEMEKYLTPTTLFRPSNFEKYLNQKITIKNETKKVPDW